MSNGKRASQNSWLVTSGSEMSTQAEETCSRQKDNNLDRPSHQKSMAPQNTVAFLPGKVPSLCVKPLALVNAGPTLPQLRVSSTALHFRGAVLQGPLRVYEAEDPRMLPRGVALTH